MTKAKRIVYWISTVWLSLGMVSTGMVQVMQSEEEIAPIIQLGYPPYFLIILGIWKLLGVVVILIPKTPLLKEWAYAGFFFAMSGALFSHIAMQQPVGEMLPSLLLLILTGLSWYFRPTERKVIQPNPRTPVATPETKAIS